ncbi:MAG: MipA/OmpV family protein [bacterium]|nr:MipA/OmpV family protein [bacterium]
MQRLITCLVLTLLCHPMLVLAAEGEAKPLWELGALGGGGLTPDYPASDEYHLAGLVLPYVLYRGKIFRAGDQGMIARGRLMRSDRFELDLSLSGSFAADSDHNDARRGMPDLDTLIEVGPRLQLTLAEPLPQGKLSFELPIRAVFSLAFDGIGYHGFTFHPRFAYQHDHLFGAITTVKLTAGPIFATAALMDYFYQVADRFSTTDRPAFNADAGYLGSEFSLLAKQRLHRNLSIFGGLKVMYYGGASNADSPLFRTKATAAIGFGFIWSFYQSKRQEGD